MNMYCIKGNYESIENMFWNYNLTKDTHMFISEIKVTCTVGDLILRYAALVILAHFSHFSYCHRLHTNKNKLRSFKSKEHINEKMDGLYRGFDYKSLFSDPLGLAKWSHREIL